MRFSTNAISTDILEGTAVHQGTAIADIKGERVFAMRAGVAVSAVEDGTECVALAIGSRAIARGLGARAVADGVGTYAHAYGLGATAISINGGKAQAFDGANVLSAHTLYTNADSDKHPSICDNNGEVVLVRCKVCNKAEGELTEWNCA